MPLYDYVCTSCGHKFEEIAKFNSPVPPCPKCGSPVERVIHANNVHYKGSGFYSVDSKHPKGANPYR